MNSHSVLTKASVGLGVTSFGFQNLKTRGPYRFPTWWGAGLCLDPITNESFIGGAYGIPVPIWPKDVPIPSASEELVKKKQSLAALRKKASDEGKKMVVAAVKRMMERDVLSGVEGTTDSVHETRSIVRMSAPQLNPTSEGRSVIKHVAGGSSASGTGCIIRKARGANKQVKTQPSPIKKREPSQRILSRKLAKKIDSLGSTYDSTVSIE